MNALPYLIAKMLAISAGVTWAAIPPKRLAWRCNTVARPDSVRRFHDQPTPLWGGAGLFLCIFVALAVACVFRPRELIDVLGPIGLAGGGL